MVGCSPVQISHVMPCKIVEQPIILNFPKELLLGIYVMECVELACPLLVIVELECIHKLLVIVDQWVLMGIVWNGIVFVWMAYMVGILKVEIQ